MLIVFKFFKDPEISPGKFPQVRETYPIHNRSQRNKSLDSYLRHTCATVYLTKLSDSGIQSSDSGIQLSVKLIREFSSHFLSNC